MVFWKIIYTCSLRQCYIILWYIEPGGSQNSSVIHVQLDQSMNNILDSIITFIINRTTLAKAFDIELTIVDRDTNPIYSRRWIFYKIVFYFQCFNSDLTIVAWWSPCYDITIIKVEYPHWSLIVFSTWENMVTSSLKGFLFTLVVINQ